MLGVGPGFHAKELVGRGAEVVAFDHSPKMVELACIRLGDQAMVRVHDLADPLDWLEDDSFDGASLALVIHHVDDRVGALRELHRVLRPGGRLVVPSPDSRLAPARGRLLHHRGDRGDVESRLVRPILASAADSYLRRIH